MNGESQVKLYPSSSAKHSQHGFDDQDVRGSLNHEANRPKWNSNMKKLSVQEPRFKPNRETDYEECTFQPKISKRSIEIAGVRTLASPEEMYKKNQEWAEQKEKFLDELRNGKQVSEERNMQECTFLPNREAVKATLPALPEAENFEHINMVSIQKFLKRYNKGRTEASTSSSAKKADPKSKNSRSKSRYLGVTIPKPFELSRPATHAIAAPAQTGPELRQSVTSFAEKSSLIRQISSASLAGSKSLAKSSVFPASSASKRPTKTAGLPQPKQPVEQSLRDLHRKKKEEVQASVKLDGEDELRYLHKKLKSIKIYTTKFD